MVFGHDSMGMETALAHVIPTRKQFGLEITRLDMKLLADMLTKKAYDAEGAQGAARVGGRTPGRAAGAARRGGHAKFNQSLAMYLIVRDLLADLNAVGGGFMSQLEWGSDRRGIPLPVADAMESLFNSTFDHNGPKRRAVRHRGRRAGPADDAVLHVADRRQSAAVHGLPQGVGAVGNAGPGEEDRRRAAGRTRPGRRRASWTATTPAARRFDWAAKPGASVEEIMASVSMPLADPGYFPGGGNTVTSSRPAGSRASPGRLAYSALTGLFSLIWDEAATAELPEPLAKALARRRPPTWPHTFVVPKYATMGEYKQYAPANHFHMIRGLSPARLQYWMDLANVLSASDWAARPAFIEGVDRPMPLIYLMNGGENNAKLMLGKKRRY